MRKQVKISKGYRLLPETHKKILKIKKLLKTDADKVIFSACVHYTDHIINLKNKLK